MSSTIIALSSDASHRFSKTPCDALQLIAGLGVMGGEVRTGDQVEVAAVPMQFEALGAV